MISLLVFAFALAADPQVQAAQALPGTDQKTYSLASLTEGKSATVIEFFSPNCPCQAAHDARLVALAEKYRAQNVQLILVDSNYGATLEGDSREAKARGYDFPIVVDPKGTWADALKARYATYSVLLDSTGKVRYRGGFDSDRHPATDHAKPYLDNALAAVLAGQEPSPTETRSVGCVLERW